MYKGMGTNFIDRLKFDLSDIIILRKNLFMCGDLD